MQSRCVKQQYANPNRLSRNCWIKSPSFCANLLSRISSLPLHTRNGEASARTGNSVGDRIDLASRIVAVQARHREDLRPDTLKLFVGVRSEDLYKRDTCKPTCRAITILERHILGNSRLMSRDPKVLGCIVAMRLTRQPPRVQLWNLDIQAADAPTATSSPRQRASIGKHY